MPDFKYIRIVFFAISFCISPVAFPHPPRVDSLLNLIRNDREDTAKISHLNFLSDSYIKNNSYDSALSCANQALNLSDSLMLKNRRNAGIILSALPGKGVACNNIGIVHWYQGNYPKALEYYNLALKIFETLSQHAVKREKNNDALRYSTKMGSTLGNMAVVYYSQGNHQKTVEYNLKALKIAEETGDKSMLATTLGNLGTVYTDKGDYPLALDYFRKALKIDEELKEKSDMANHMSNIGAVYNEQGNYHPALEYFYSALKLYEQLGNTSSMAKVHGNIGLVYKKQKNYSKSLHYFTRSLKINTRLGNKSGIARHLGNIGNVYIDQGDFSKALDYYSRALKIGQETGDKTRIAIQLGNIGNCYKQQGDSPGIDLVKRDSFLIRALDYYFLALKANEELGRKNAIAIQLGNIGSVFIEQKKYRDAYHYLYRALALSSGTGSLDGMKHRYETLSALYENADIPLSDTIGGNLLNPAGMRLRALYYYKRYITICDTLFSEENKKQLVRKEMNYEFEKKEAATRAEQDKKMAVTAAESKRQRLLIGFIAAIASAAVVIAILIFRSLKVTRNQKKTIAKQKTEVEEKNIQLVSVNEKITLQKEIIEEKNRDITDSITYASYIQRAILTPEEEIRKFLPGCFILYRPKEIVSGDFYWFYPLRQGYQLPNDGIVSDLVPADTGSTKARGGFLALADCTGHGVPGAFISMIGNDLLNQIVNEEKMTTAALMLDALNTRFNNTIHPMGAKTGLQDSMEIGIFIIDFHSLTLQYAGAKRPLLLVTSGNALEIPAETCNIGDEKDAEVKFKNHEFHLKAGDTFYLFSDGFGDQFGGPGTKSRKFGTKRLKELLSNIAGLDITEQKDTLEKTFESWKQNNEQVDDVLVIGFKV